MIAVVRYGRREIEDLAECVARERFGIAAAMMVATWDPENGLELRFDEEPEPKIDDEHASPWGE